MLLKSAIGALALVTTTASLIAFLFLSTSLADRGFIRFVSDFFSLASLSAKSMLDSAVSVDTNLFSPASVMVILPSLDPSSCL